MNNNQNNSNNNDGQNGQSSNRGFAGMSEEERRKIASKGGQSQGKENNPGNFANDRDKASRAGSVGGSR
jgi:general stress protein YciG